MPDDLSTGWLPRQQILNVLNFYYPECIGHVHGGYVLQFDEEDGHVYDGKSRHLVGTCRAIHNFCVGVEIGGPDWCRSAAEHGLRFLLDHHRDEERGGFAWLLSGTEPEDDDRYAYGHAFVLLALARATAVGITGAEAELSGAYDLVKDRFWEEEYGLCLDRATADWEPYPYRGQNANMHACEALIVAYEATGEERYLEDAHSIAEALALERAGETDGRIWEHYTEDWEHDFRRDRDDTTHRFGPWGYQPGHNAEWAKLLCQLAEHREEAWLGERAAEMFDWAVSTGWDAENGGLFYTVDPDGEPIDTNKYGWPVTEAIGAAALLAEREGDTGATDGGSGNAGAAGLSYREWYERLWEYALENLVNPKCGIWYQRRTRENDPMDRSGGPTIEPGYHPVGNAYAVLRADES